MVPQLSAAVLFLCTAASIGGAFLEFPQGPAFGSIHVWDWPMKIAAAASPFVFLGASSLVFLRPRYGYRLGLVAGLMALPMFIQDELSLAPWNSWIYLNYESPIPSDRGAFLTFANLNILSVALIVVSFVCALVRCLPARWLLRNFPLCQRTWPAFLVGLLVMAVWFVHSVTPYSLPVFHDGVDADFKILHVQKRGLRFQETTVDGFREGRTYIVRNDRRLFQYRFEGRINRISLWEVSPTAYQHGRALVESAELWTLHTPPPKALKSWDAEGWYVVLKDKRLLTFSTEYGTSPPKEVVELFHEIESLPASEEQPFATRDVCLGFCYDPMAALGFVVRRHRAQVLAASGYGGEIR
jgi:hypothetical protein